MTMTKDPVFQQLTPAPIEDGKITKQNVEDVFEEWQEKLRLNHWLIEIDLDSEKVAGEEASVAIPEDYDCGRVRVEPGWPEWTAYNLNEVAIHELLHCQLHKFRMAAKEGSRALGGAAAELYERRLDHELENTIDQMTLALLDIEGIDAP